MVGPVEQRAVSKAPWVREGAHAHELRYSCKQREAECHPTLRYNEVTKSQG